MIETVIKINKISKKYTLQHKHKDHYKTIRDVVANATRAFTRRIFDRSHTLNTFQSKEEFWALQDVSFEVSKGEVIGIIGHNGAGKSTLLKILSRITQPTAGKIHLNGRVASLLEVGTGFHPELTGRENIFLNGAILGMNRNEISRRFDDIVNFAEIKKFLDTPVKRYSSGMYVRLAFSVAAHLEPEILLVDEVLAVGDTAFQKKCLNRIKDVGNLGRTVVFVSHNMGAVLKLCSRVVVMNKGRVIYDGLPSDSIDTYINMMIAKGSPGKTHFVRSKKPGMLRLERFCIKDAEGNTVENLVSGKKYYFQFLIHANQSVQWDKVRMGFAFGTMHEVMLVYCDNAYSGESAPVSNNTTMVFRCEIPKLPFISGQYLIRGKVYYGENAVDELDHITAIHVEKGLFYATGKQAFRNPVLIEYNWEFFPSTVPVEEIYGQTKVADGISDD